MAQAVQELMRHADPDGKEAVLSVAYDDETLAVQGFKIEKNTRDRGKFYVMASGRRIDIGMESQRTTDVLGERLAGKRDREGYVYFPFSVTYET